jgi:hypothetical protein
MGLATKVYEAFKDDEEKARVLAEVIDELESRLSPLRDVATKGDLEVTKLALQKEIEQVRLTLQKEIEQVRLSLQKEMEQVRREIEGVRASVVKWVAGLLVVQTGVIVSIITLLR